MAIRKREEMTIDLMKKAQIKVQVEKRNNI